MNVLSLFDGCSCGQLALSGAGIKVDNYYASEIDKYAIKVTQANFPNTIQLGDINNWREWSIDWSSIDLLIGGSPCQGFSFAGKQLLFDDPRSKLFFVYVDILNHIRAANPRIKFMLENVQMKEIALNTISYYLGVEPVFINSKDYSCCERPRFYWFNWGFSYPTPTPVFMGDTIDFDCQKNIMPDGWHNWFDENKDFQIRKKYSRIINEKSQAITLTTRQYASWNGNFIPVKNKKFRKMNKQELALCMGATKDYFKDVSQRQAEVISGNGWQVDTIIHIFKQMNKPLKGQIKLF